MHNNPKGERRRLGWLPEAIARIRVLADARKVRFTLKARQELANLESGLDEDDASDLLASLTAEDSAGRVSSVATGEWMYVFLPHVGEQIMYVKLVLREDCVVVSFHENEDGAHEEGEWQDQ